jgi:hypothetical protein
MGMLRIRDLRHDARMSNAFDPETGARIVVAQPAAPARVRTAPRNPYETALAAIWIGSLALAFVLLLVGSSMLQAEAYDVPDPRATGAATIAGAGAVGLLAVFTGIVHLAVRAIAWRPPER